MTPFVRPSSMTEDTERSIARAIPIYRVSVHGTEPDPDPDPGLDPVGYSMTLVLHVR